MARQQEGIVRSRAAATLSALFVMTINAEQFNGA